MQRRAVHSGAPVDGEGSGNGTTALPERTVRRQRRLKNGLRHRNADLPKLLFVIVFGVTVIVLSAATLWKIATMVGHRIEGGGGPQNNVIRDNHPGGASSESSHHHHHRHDEGEKEKVRHTENDDMFLPWNSLYKVPDSLPHVGDRSNDYVKLRMAVDPQLPLDAERSHRRVAELTSHKYEPMPMDVHHSDQIAYDVYNCPDTPPAGYPFAWSSRDVLTNWPPDDPTPRSHIHQGLCVFDFEQDYDKAMAYRHAEVPFVVANDPDVHAAVERWNMPGYMEQLMGDVEHRCEYSANNHFMYYAPGAGAGRKKKKNNKTPADWKPPTEMHRMRYLDWLAHANVTDGQLGPDKPHWYYRLIGCGLMGNKGECDRGSSEYLYDELKFFQPESSLYVVEPEEQKGIHCRFGMKGVIAENHFDGSRNAIVVLSGSRRYILSHPAQCPYLALFPKGHPSARHSQVDWSDPDWEEFPQFEKAMLNEVVMQPGQVLYLPTNWFHYIVSLELNMQCNTRSGISEHYMEPIRHCGF